MKVFYPSLVQWCADSVATAIAQLTQDHPAPILMPAFKVEQQPFGLITSPIVLWLAAQQQDSPENVGQRLIVQLQQMEYLHAPQISLQANHWLYFEFSDLALSHWLHHCYETEVMLEGSEHCSDRSLPPMISENPQILTLQYAHARCCSLLRLAAETLEIPSPQETTIPWLNDFQQLQCQHPSEQALIRQFLKFPHGFSPKKQIAGVPFLTLPGYQSELFESMNLSRLQALSEAFLMFHRDCRVFGATQSLDLIQTRLALIHITQRLLAFALNHGLHQFAPISL